VASIEKEVKLILSPEDSQRIREHGREVECRNQLNVYFHDPGRLREEAAATGYFRVRFESGRRPVATLKLPAGWEGAVRAMVEIEYPLEALGPALYPRPRRMILVEADLPSEMARYFLDLGITRLRRLGWMRNRRRVLELEGVGEVELDRTDLPGGEIHHELEIERGDVAHLHLVLERVKGLAPSATVSKLGKFPRFLEALAAARASEHRP
jgi:hypothetical protein